MIVVRFFTGVVINYPDADFYETSKDGFVNICKGTPDNRVVLSTIQPTAGCVIERGENISVMNHPALRKGKYLWEK